MRPIRSVRRALLVVIALTALSLPVSAMAGVRIASWNLKHLGWNNGKNLQAVAKLIGRFDLVAIQEVMDPAAARRLAKIVSEDTGEPWGVTTSQIEGDSSYKEQGLGAEYGHMRELYTRAPWKQ